MVVGQGSMVDGRWVDGPGSPSLESPSARDFTTHDSRLSTIDYRPLANSRSNRGLPLSGAKLGSIPQPARGEVVRHLEELLEDVERLVILTGYDIEPRQDMLKVRTGDLVLVRRQQ